MGETKTKILLIDSDQGIRSLLAANLCVCYQVDSCASADDALDMDLTKYDLIITDINLEGSISGLDFSEMLQRSPRTSEIALIFCTALDSEDDIIRGFDAGADDYILKPFSLREVVARVRSVIRRRSMTMGAMSKREAAETVKIDGLEVNLTEQRVTRDGEAVSLSRIEFQLLATLLRDPGQPFTRIQLQKKVWADDETVSSRAVDVNISRLRKKLGPYGVIIASVPGTGYKAEYLETLTSTNFLT